LRRSIVDVFLKMVMLLRSEETSGSTFEGKIIVNPYPSATKQIVYNALHPESWVEGVESKG
jgi:hypothetical protein